MTFEFYVNNWSGLPAPVYFLYFFSPLDVFPMAFVCVCVCVCFPFILLMAIYMEERQIVPPARLRCFSFFFYSAQSA